MDIAMIYEAAPSVSDAGLETARRLLPALRAGSLLRLDLAWQLFVPDQVGPAGLDIPAGNPRVPLRGLADWMRLRLSWAATGTTPAPVVAIAPQLAPAADEWVRRHLSFYADRVALYRWAPGADPDAPAREWPRFAAGEPSGWQDAFLPPIIRPWPHPGALLEKSKKVQGAAEFVFLTAALGSDRLAVQSYRIAPFGRGNRLHAHSDLDELYLVWEGEGTLRMARRTVPLRAGDVVSKPGGSRLALEFVAGPAGLTILDIEGWRDFGQSDAVYYPDHGEWYLRGPGLELAVSEEGMVPGSEVMTHYLDAYRRRADGRRQTDAGD